MDDHSPSEGGFWTSVLGLFKAKSENLADALREAEEEGEIAGADMAMLQNVLALGRRAVSDTMIPRTDIICAEIEDSLDEVSRVIVESGHSRIPIYEGDKDNIVGIIHAKDLLSRLLHPGDGPTSIQDLMRQPMFIPENKNLRDMLQEFRNSKTHLAIAVDEYGGTSGLITLEDVLEEIVGEIEDEYDTDDGPEEFQDMGNGTYVVSGRLLLEDLNESLGTGLDSEQVETIGGYLCEVAGRVPRQGETFGFAGWTFQVKEADKKQVRWIQVEPAQEPED